DRLADDVMNTRAGDRDDEPVPALPQHDRARGGVRSGIDRRSGRPGELNHSALRPVARAARAVGDDGEIATAAVRFEETAEAADPAARRRPVDDLDPEGDDRARDERPVAVPAVHDADAAPEVRERHHDDPPVPEREDHALVAREFRAELGVVLEGLARRRAEQPEDEVDEPPGEKDEDLLAPRAARDQTHGPAL